MGPGTAPKTGANFEPIWGLPREGASGAQAGKYYPPGRVMRCIWGPGGRLQRGVLSLRTSDFWRPDLGDLEAKNLDSLEDYSLVAKNPSPQQPGGPTRGPADLLTFQRKTGKTQRYVFTKSISSDG